MTAARRPHLIALALALAIFKGPAHAGTYDIFGVTPRDIGMGGAMTGAVIGFSALYYNPAALTLDRANSLGLNLQLSVPFLDIDREDPSASPPSVLPDSHAGATLGWVKPIGGVFDDRLAFGVALSLPLERLLRVQGIDPAAPQFYLYQNLQDKLLIHLGAAGDVFPWLSVGAGVQILADLDGDASLELDILSGRFDRRTMGVTLAPTLSPFVGLHLRPPLGAGQLKLGLAFRGSSRLAFDLPVRVSEGDLLDLDIRVSQTVLWTPHQLAFGLAYTADDPAFTLAVDLTYALWSEAPDPSPRLSVDIGGRLIESFGLDNALDLSVNAAPLDLSFADTLTARIGAEYSPTGWLTLRGGYFYRPTPAPAQTGSTAYLDNDAHVLSLGLGVSFRNPLRERESVVDLDWSLQATLLPRRTVYRTAPDNPGGDLSHAGQVWHTSLGVVHRF
jgi:long-chain fatty acid transport protein